MKHEITTADIVHLREVSERTAREIKCTIKKLYEKNRKQYLTVEEYAKYYKIPPEAVYKALNRYPQK